MVFLKKRKAESEAVEEDGVGESKRSSDEFDMLQAPEGDVDSLTEAIESIEADESQDTNDEETMEEPFDILMAPDWDVDSFEGLEYYSSPDMDLSSDEQPYSDMEKANKHYRIYKRQIIESKGFYAEAEFSLFYNYRSIFPNCLKDEALEGKNFRQFWEEMAIVCLQKHKQDKDLNVEFVEVVRGNFHAGPRSKSYITFMAREKPDGPLVEYQAKAMLTLDGKMHPILCRPSPVPKP